MGRRTQCFKIYAFGALTPASAPAAGNAVQRLVAEPRSRCHVWPLRQRPPALARRAIFRAMNSLGDHALDAQHDWLP